MEQYAHIPKIEGGLVFSDPMYDEKVWCQYRREFTDTNWLMKMESKLDEEYSTIDFNLFIGRPSMMSTTSVKEASEGNLMISSLRHYDMKEVEIGMDTARIYCGSIKNWDQYADDAALHTGTDGMFGQLIAFSCKGNDLPTGFLLMGSIDQTFVNEKSLFQHFTATFDGQEIPREVFSEKTDRNSMVNKVMLAQELNAARAATQVHGNTLSTENEPER